MHLTLCHVALVCHQYNVCKKLLEVGILVGMVVWTNADFPELFPVGILVVSEIPTDLL